jgi:murein L,D-transpeptidase YcbB/YkuD
VRFSHGCIRMDRPAEMAAWVLGGKEKGWSLVQVNEVIASRKRKVVVLDKPVPVYLISSGLETPREVSQTESRLSSIWLQ